MVFIVNKYKMCLLLDQWNAVERVDASISALGLSDRNESSEGAVGFTPEAVTSSSVSQESTCTLTKEQDEIRRRRIEKFSQVQGSD
jgi:hypothetical protein